MIPCDMLYEQNMLQQRSSGKYEEQLKQIKQRFLSRTATKQIYFSPCCLLHLFFNAWNSCSEMTDSDTFEPEQKLLNDRNVTN
jgi:hypothetical protein